MTNTDRLRIDWLEREGHHRQLVTVYGPFFAYNKWEVRAWAALAIVTLSGLIVFIMDRVM